LLNNRQQSGRRRGRGGQRQQGTGRDNGNRIDNRARGNAPQMLEKYKTLARDSQMLGDRVMTEYYLQFADHYFRVVAESRARFEENRRPREEWQGDEGYEGEEQGLSEGSEGENAGDDMRPQQPRREFQGRNERPERPERNDRNRDRYSNDRDDRFNGNRAREEEYRDGRDDDRPEPGRIDVAVLPPAFASDGPMPSVDIGDEPPVDEAPAPRRRGRPRKPSADAPASE